MCRLLLPGVLAVPSKNGSPGPKWGQAIFVLLWVLVYDITIGVSWPTSSD